QYNASAAGKKNAITVIIIGIIYNIIFICGLSAVGLSAIINFCCKNVAAPAISGKTGSVDPSSNHRKLPVLMASVRIIAWYNPMKIGIWINIGKQPANGFAPCC